MRCYGISQNAAQGNLEGCKGTMDTYSDTRVVSILDRRKQLKNQRRSQFLQSTWRTCAILSCAIGLGWLFSKPEWQLRNTNQVQILGNSQISSQTIEAFLPLSFPTSLLRVKPGDIKASLKKHTHLDQVFIKRQLFPPHVDIQVQERLPIAVTTCRRCVLVANWVEGQPITLGPTDLWLLDAQGIPLPYESYPKLRQVSKIPELVATGYLKPLTAENAKTIKIKDLPAQVTLVSVDSTLQKQWQQALKTVNSSPVKIHELNWSDPNNLQFKTDLGLIELGPFSDKIPAQIRALDQMRSLPQSTDFKKIKSIDLQDPKQPVVELNASTPSSKPQKSP
jgi:cell division protein FtsQ